MKNLKFIASILLILPLISCGGGGGSSSGGDAPLPNPSVTPSPSPSPSVGGLSVTAPVSYPLFSGATQLATNVYFTVTNTSNTATAVTYSVPTSANTSGATVSGPSSCQSVQPNASCTGFIQVSGGNTGAISLQVSGNSSTTNSSLFSKVKSLFGISSVEDGTNATVGLTQLPPNDASGADGINLLYPSQVIASSSGSTIVNIVAAVNSLTAGNFDEIRLVDSSGNNLNYIPLSGNSGQGLTNLSRGSVVTLQLTIPSSASSFTFYVQTVENGQVVSTSNVPNLITLSPSGTSTPIIQVVPLYSKQLNVQQTTQVITYTNTGNATASNIVIDAGGVLSIESNLCSTSLAPGASCNVTVAFNPSQNIGSGVAPVSMRYGASPNVQSVVANIPYQGAENPSPGINLSAGLSGLIFSANTNSDVATNIVTLTNTGSTVESNFVLTLPNYFSVAATTGASPCIINGNTITSSLAVNGQCTFQLIYTNATPTPQSMADLDISYTYNNNQTAEGSFLLTYQTTQAAAVLSISPTSVDFGNILNNGTQSESQVVTITNIGTNPAESISSMSITGASQFTTTSNNCPGSGVLAVGASCTYTFMFADNSGANTGTESATASFSYLPYAGAQSQLVNINLTGTILAPGTADINATTSASGFAGGDGSESNPYQIESGGSATISISYTNTGNYPAESFYTQYNALLPIQGNFWTDISHGCSESLNITLESNPGSTCTDIVGTANLPVGLVAESQTVWGQNIWMFWTDQAGSYSQRNPNFPPVYVNVYAPPSISYAISNPQNESTFSPGESFTITATLTGGYNVQPTTITASNLPTGITLNLSTCQVSSMSNTCNVVATVGNNATSGNYSINFSNGGNITQTNNSVNFNMKFDTYLAVGYTGDLKVYGGLSSPQTASPIYESFIDCFDQESCGSNEPITSIVIDNNNNLYAAQSFYGYVYRVTGFNTANPVESYNQFNYLPIGNGVTSMLVANNTLYVGTIKASGANVYQLADASTNDPNLLVNGSLSLAESNYKTVGTLAMVNSTLYAGLWPDYYFNITLNSTSSALFSYNSSWSSQPLFNLNTRPVASVVESNGNIYFATQGRNDGPSPQIIRYNTNNSESSVIFDSFTSTPPILAMVINSDGSMLYFIYNNQVCKLATNTSSTTTSCNQVGSISNAQLLAIDRNDVLYVSTFSAPSYLIDTYDTKSASPSWTQFITSTDEPISAITAY